MSRPQIHHIEANALIMGAVGERIDELASTLSAFVTNTVTLDTSTDVQSDGKPFRPCESCRLAILTDTDPPTRDIFDRISDLFPDSTLILACISETEASAATEWLEARVDDLVFSSRELEMRIAYIGRRIRIRETSQKQYQAIFETIADGVVTMDDKSRITAFNRSAENIFGHTAEEVFGKSIAVLMPEPLRSGHVSFVSEYLKTGRKRIIGIGREVIGVRKDGSLFPMELAVSEVKTGGKRLFTGVVRDITERRMLEQEILRISDQERRRIGQDLHDGLGQMLTGIGLIAQNLAHRLQQDGSDLAEDMSEVAELVKEADRSARTLSRGLVPVELDEMGLGNALQSLARNAEKLFNIQCTLNVSGSVQIPDLSANTNLYRIAQEAVSNAVKHGKADTVRISLSARSRRIEMLVKDNGVGFPTVLPEDRGMGVRIMKYRARVIGASFDIRRDPRGGTLVSCILNV